MQAARLSNGGQVRGNSIGHLSSNRGALAPQGQHAVRRVRWLKPPHDRQELPHIHPPGNMGTPTVEKAIHARAVGRNIRLSRTEPDGAALPVSRISTPASPSLTDRKIQRTINRNRAGKTCPLKHIGRDEPCISVSAKPGGCGSVNRLQTHRGSGRGINPAGLCFVTAFPGAFRSMNGGLLRPVGIGTTAAIGVTNRLNRFLTDRRSRCASSFATTRSCTPGT